MPFGLPWLLSSLMTLWLLLVYLIKLLQWYILSSTSSYDETCHVTILDDWDHWQWLMTWTFFSSDMASTTVSILCHHFLLVLPPYEGSSILESSWWLYHQVLGMFLVLLVLPLFILFSRYSLRVLFMRSLEYMFLQSLMNNSYQFKISYSTIFDAYFLVCSLSMHLKWSIKFYGQSPHSKRMKDGGGGALRHWHVLMHPKERKKNIKERHMS